MRLSVSGFRGAPAPPSRAFDRNFQYILGSWCVQDLRPPCEPEKRTSALSFPTLWKVAVQAYKSHFHFQISLFNPDLPHELRNTQFPTGWSITTSSSAYPKLNTLPFLPDRIIFLMYSLCQLMATSSYSVIQAKI